MMVLVVTPLGSTAASYYFRGQEAGRWLGGATGLLGLGGDVAYLDLVRVLRGCHPDHGGFLPASKPARRRAGWDLTLAAPKSLSLLAGSTTAGGKGIKDAHRAAVEGVVDDLEQRHLTARRGRAAPAAGVVAACFDHWTNGAGEPHLHSHLLLCNLACDQQGVWGATSDSWWTGRRALGAVYQLGLRHHLRAGGFELDWRLHGDGLGDLADVPRAAVRATSGRSRAATADRDAFRAEGKGGRTYAIRSGAIIRSRPSEPSQPWQHRVRAAGFESAAADALVAAGRVGANQIRSEANLERAVTMWLATRRSSFRHEDVLIALAACAPGGLPAREAERWVERFCQAAIPVEAGPTSARRWTTAIAQAADRRLVELVDRRTRLARGAAEVADAREGPPSWPVVRPAVRQLLAGPGSVHLLAAPPGWTNLLAHAALLEQAGPAWTASGLRTAVATSSRQAEIRWQTLTGIAPYRPGAGADVLIVDHADRRSTADLLGLLAGLNRTSRVILVEGGTLPRVSWLHSDGLGWLGDRLGRLDPGPAPAWVEHIRPHRIVRPTEEIPTAYPSAAQAAGDLLARWASGSRQPATALVGMGYPEVDGLNQAARGLLARRGELSGPGLTCGGRVFQAGDRVISLRRLSGDLPPGSPLEVVAVDPRRSTLTVSWQGTQVEVDRRAASHLGYRYAVTPALAARLAAPLLVLGPPSALGRHQDRVMAAAIVAPAPELGLGRAPTRRELPEQEIGWSSPERRG
jgi:conjugative relaxase-like TrwC/TraI family protein